MINLLPDDTKQTILYARRNRRLLRWAGAMLMGGLGVGVVVLVGIFYLNYSTTAFAKEVEQNKSQLALQKLEQTQKRIQEISNTTKLVSQVLSREVLFSKLLQGIGAAMPPGAALQNLSIGKLDGGIDLQVAAVDYQTGTQAQVNLQDPANKIFDKADIINITCTNPSQGTQSKYPCQVNLRASFAKNSPYLFSNPTGGVKR
jgi:hypothetical protein